MAVNSDDCRRQRQEDEIIALESIFSPNEIKRSEEVPSAGQFFATVEVPEGFCIINRHPHTKHEETVTISFLPPLVLHYSLPEQYPSRADAPPTFILTCQWLNRLQLSQLCMKLDMLWQENHVGEQGSEILYTWAYFLKNDSLDFLKIGKVLYISGIRNIHHIQRVPKQTHLCSGSVNAKVPHLKKEEIQVDSSAIQNQDTNNVEWVIKEPSDKHSTWTCFTRPTLTVDKRAKSNQKKNKSSKCLRELDCRALNDLPQDTSLIEVLRSYNETQEKEHFSKGHHTCNICFDTKLGSHFTRFHPCNHILCSECANGYFTATIEGGKVQNILCPEEKCNSEAQFNQIKEHISPELFAKYDKMLLDVTLATLGDIIQCPRPTCQYSVTIDGEEKLATCFYCRYAFCVDCRMGYHGVEPCRLKASEERRLVGEYKQGDDKVRKELEQRYGKRRLEDLVQNSMTIEWMEDNSKRCPTCKAAIQKTSGCNKMVCWKCNTNFCWLCNSKLNSVSPYSHFNSRNSQCFNLLFQGMDIDEPDMFENDVEWLNADVFDVVDVN